MKHLTRPILLLTLLSSLLLSTALPAFAQNFYGSGNVLIAVDMAQYAENDMVDYPEGTMGTLIWGEDAPTGENTRPAFSPHSAKVSPEPDPPVAPEYAVETFYEPGQRALFPYGRVDDPDLCGQFWMAEEDLPAGLFRDGVPLFWININRVMDVSGEIRYSFPAEKTGDSVEVCCVDFLEFQCVAVTAHSTVWQYTGTAISDRSGFDPSEYMDAVEVNDDELVWITDICDTAWEREGALYNDPRFEDMQGDRDGKASYFIMGLDNLLGKTLGYYDAENTDLYGIDCLFINACDLPGRTTWIEEESAGEYVRQTLIHELNHYIQCGRVEHNIVSAWVEESLADHAIVVLDPEAVTYLLDNRAVTFAISGLRMIPGLLWSDGPEYGRSNYSPTVYNLGPLFLRYVEQRSMGVEIGGLWPTFAASRTPERPQSSAELDAFLMEKTGEGLESWLAAYMAAVVVGAEDGPYRMGDAGATAAFRFDQIKFFRDSGEYGKYLGGIDEQSATDAETAAKFIDFYGITAIQGGGTTYAYRNDAGGNIAITGADDRWYFFALDMDLPKGFPDVPEAAWYHDAVTRASDAGLLQIRSGEKFYPDADATRAMAVTMLWRLAGEPEAASAAFVDVESGVWYEKAVNWAFAQGIVCGTSAETFSPDKPITREQFAAMLYRYVRSHGGGFTGAWTFPLDFQDTNQVSDYAYEALCWMTMNGVFQGFEDGTLRPQGETTRAQAAALVERFCALPAIAP